MTALRKPDGGVRGIVAGDVMRRLVGQTVARQIMHSNIRVHLGKIKVWNASGVEPRACQILQRIPDASGNLEGFWIAPLSCRASKFSEHLLVTQTSLQPIWNEF